MAGFGAFGTPLVTRVDPLFGVSVFGNGTDLPAAASVGQGALAMAVGRARAVSGLPITIEEAAKSVYDSVNGPGAAAADGLMAAVNGAGRIFADAVGQAADDVGANLADVSRGMDVLRSAYTSQGADLAARAASILGGGTAATAASYSLVYVGTMLYQQGVFDSIISTIKTAVLDSDAFKVIGDTLGLSGALSPAAGAFISVAVGTLSAMWDAWKTGTSIKIGTEPPAEYWGQIATAIYAWDETGCSPSWGRVRDTNSPTFDPILREWQVVRDISLQPRRMIDVFGREKMRGVEYRRWITRDEGGEGCPTVGATATDGTVRYNPHGEGMMYNPSAWPPNDASRMRGAKAPYYCAHAAKVQVWCDGSNRNNHICRSAAQYGPGTGLRDRSYLLRGAFVAATYLGANVAGIQNLGEWSPPNCGWGDGTWIPGLFWDLGIGGIDGRGVRGAARSNWLACVINNGQVFLRPPVPVDAQLRSDSSTTDRVKFLNKGTWYPMYAPSMADGIALQHIVSRWSPFYADFLEEERPIPLTVENGIAQASPVIPTTTRIMIPSRPKVAMVSSKATGSSVVPVVAGVGIAAALAYLVLAPK